MSAIGSMSNVLAQVDLLAQVGVLGQVAVHGSTLNGVTHGLSVSALQHYLAVGGILFSIGMIGFMCRRNLIIMFLCTELMFQGVAINLIAFGRYWGNLSGQAFVVFVLVVAAAEAALALGLIILLFRQKQTLDSEAWRELKG